VSDEWVAQQMLDIRNMRGRSDDDAPDIVLVTDEINDATLAALYRAAGCIVDASNSASVSSRARAVGTAVLTNVTVASWHRAATGIVGTTGDPVAAGAGPAVHGHDDVA
jgi:hypothetical protein